MALFSLLIFYSLRHYLLMINAISLLRHISFDAVAITRH